MNYKLTSVKILKDLYKKFKYNTISDEFTLQKLVNRSMDLYLMDDDFKQQVYASVKKVIKLKICLLVKYW